MCPVRLWWGWSYMRFAGEQSGSMLGSNSAGQLDGTTTNRLSPVTVSGLTCTLLEVPTPVDSSNNTVQCWGSNSAGQLGDGTTADLHQSVSPVFPLQPRSMREVEEVIPVPYFQQHRSVLGSNGYGQLGDGTTTNRTTGTTIWNLQCHHRCCRGRTYLCNARQQYSSMLRKKWYWTTWRRTTTPVGVSGISNATMLHWRFSFLCPALWQSIKAGEAIVSVNLEMGQPPTEPPVTVSGISTATAISAGTSLPSCALLTVLFSAEVRVMWTKGMEPPQANSPVTVSGISTTVVTELSCLCSALWQNH